MGGRIGEFASIGFAGQRGLEMDTGRKEFVCAFVAGGLGVWASGGGVRYALNTGSGFLTHSRMFFGYE